MKVLIACEESQAVTIEFRKLGIEAFSCDIQPCSGGFPEFHFQKDVFEVIESQKWDLMIAFPPCTYLTLTGNKWFLPEYKDRFPNRLNDRKEAIEFFKKLYNSDIKHIAIENPVGVMSSELCKPSQIIQPYYFGDSAQKKTCLWLKNLPHLIHSKQVSLFDSEITHVEKEKIITSKSGKNMGEWYYKTGLVPLKNGLRAKERSKTFSGIASAMAKQWSEYLINL
jgi:hypothetical protein